MMQFLWKWAAFIIIDASLTLAGIALFGGKIGEAWIGVVALGGAALIITAFIAALLYLRIGGSDLNAPAVVAMILIVIGIIVVGAVGWGWLKSVMETDWRFWLAAILLPVAAALQVWIGHIGRPLSAN